MRLVIYDYLPLSMVLFRLSCLSRFERLTLLDHHHALQADLISLRTPATASVACDFAHLIGYFQGNPSVEVRL